VLVAVLSALSGLQDPDTGGLANGMWSFFLIFPLQHNGYLVTCSCTTNML
jgi:hypothetical protein